MNLSLHFSFAISINFFLPRLVPGNPLQLIAGNAAPQLGKERVEALRAQYGLDKPLSEQYLIYLKQLARGDLGMSYRYSGGRTVVEVLCENFRWTLLLVGISLIAALLIGSALGIWSATQRGDPVDLGLLERSVCLAVHTTILAGDVIDTDLRHSTSIPTRGRFVFHPTPGRLGKCQRCGTSCIDAGDCPHAGIFTHSIRDHARRDVWHSSSQIISALPVRKDCQIPGSSSSMECETPYCQYSLPLWWISVKCLVG